MALNIQLVPSVNYLMDSRKLYRFVHVRIEIHKKNYSPWKETTKLRDMCK